MLLTFRPAEANNLLEREMSCLMLRPNAILFAWLKYVSINRGKTAACLHRSFKVVADVLYGNPMDSNFNQSLCHTLCHSPSLRGLLYISKALPYPHFLAKMSLPLLRYAAMMSPFLKFPLNISSPTGYTVLNSIWMLSLQQEIAR